MRYNAYDSLLCWLASARIYFLYRDFWIENNVILSFTKRDVTNNRNCLIFSIVKLHTENNI